MQWHWVQQKDGTTLWEYSDFAEKLEGVRLEEYNGFGGPGWSRSVETAYREEGDYVIRAAPLTVGADLVNLAGGKANHP